jgi:hypothetical protein
VASSVSAKLPGFLTLSETLPRLVIDDAIKSAFWWLGMLCAYAIGFITIFGTGCSLSSSELLQLLLLLPEDLFS